mmetsp:Transcript_24696/g.38433  ORF Transcript_24696/g.38433 Transcript_24696/m.38433 type:complete len:88 (+) Transcript_24696:482-745(+)
MLPIWVFLICALVDVHAVVFIVSAYNYTSITSVMLLEDITIPMAVLLSVFFLKIKYKALHFWGIVLCLIGMSFSLINDLYLHPDSSS